MSTRVSIITQFEARTKHNSILNPVPLIPLPTEMVNFRCIVCKYLILAEGMHTQKMDKLSKRKNNIYIKDSTYILTVQRYCLFTCLNNLKGD